VWPQAKKRLCGWPMHDQAALKRSYSRSSLKLVLHPAHRFLARPQLTLELRIFHRRENFLEPWAGMVAHRNQVSPVQQWRRSDFGGRSGSQLV